MMNMWGKMRINSKVDHAVTCTTKEVEINKKERKSEASPIKATKTELPIIAKVDNAVALCYETPKNKTVRENDNEDHNLQLFNLFEDIPQTPEIEVKNADKSILLEDIKLESGIDLGELGKLDSMLPEMKLLKTSATEKQNSSHKMVCLPPKATCSKPCRIKRLPAKLVLNSVKMNKAKPVITKPKCGKGVRSKSAAQLRKGLLAKWMLATEDKCNGSLNGVVNHETAINSCEKVAHGSISDIPNSEIKRCVTKDKNIKITMTKIGDGLWEQSLTTTIRKRRYNSWKRGKYEKCKKKVKMEPTDHDYSLISSPFNGTISNLGSRLNSLRVPTAASSPSPRCRIKSSRLLECVEPVITSKLSLSAALDQQLPCPSAACSNESASVQKVSKVKCDSDTNAPAICVKLEANDSVKITSKAKKLGSKKPSKNRPLPKIVARKGKRSVGRPKINRREEVPTLRKKLKKKSEVTKKALTVDASKTTTSDPPKRDESNAEKKSSPIKEVLKEKTKKSSVKEKKLSKEKIFPDKNKTQKIKKIHVIKKKDIEPAKFEDKTCKKLTSKAKAIRMQLKADKKKKLKDKKVSKKVKLKKVSNLKSSIKLVANAESEEEKASVPSSPMSTVETVQSPKKVSLNIELEKTKKAKMIETKESAPMASESKEENGAPSISPNHKQTSPSTCSLNQDLRRGRGRPRTRIPREPSIRFSRNGLRLGRPPKQKDSPTDIESNLVASQVKFLRPTFPSCYNTESLSARETSASRPDYLLPKTSIQSNAQLAKSKSVTFKAPISLSAYTLPPQPLLAASNPKRSSVRQTECAFRYREIAVKKQDNFIQIVLMTSTRVKNGLNCQVMHELQMALMAAKSDPKCSVVVVNGTGSVFCSGVDLISLSMDLGQSTAEKTSSAIRDFCKALLSFPKPLIAAVNGAAVGLGVTFLPFFDLVYASDKATFYTPYGKLGQIPEGGATFTFPVLMGYAKANGLLLEGRRITATEAHDNGLVTQVLWPATFMEEVIPRVQAIANRPLQAMESTKALVRYHEQSKLEVTLDTECRVLLQQWSSDECRLAIRDFLTTEEVV